jgi:hypothetical protein
MIDALLGMVTGNPYHADGRASTTNDAIKERSHRQRNVPIISYAMRGQATLVNCWEDPHFFTAAFPTLFPSGIGGHLDQRKDPVSLVAFAEWALNHHSRRRVVSIK